jgi:DNA-binding transcriptional LysR family regulator
MLPSHQLEAFVAVAQTLNFTKAARLVGVTQSALSQRVSNLEGELGLTLLVRERAGIRLTEQGTMLLRYCRARERLEDELLGDLRAGRSAGAPSGVVRIGGYSSVVRSVLMPALGALIREHASVQIEVFVRELRELPQLLRTGEADLVVLDRRLAGHGVEEHLLGHERHVLVERRQAGGRRDCFLDHDAEDTTTAAFLRQQRPRAPGLRRSFLDDIYGILDGVAAGWGRAVVPWHLCRERRDLRVVAGQRPLENPVVLHHPALPYQTTLHRLAVEALCGACPPLLPELPARKAR